MLGLGNYISNSDVSSGTPGAFRLTHTLNSDADRFRIKATEVNHAGDTNFEDTAPGVKIKNLVFKVNGTAVSTFDLDSAYADTGSTVIYDDVTVVNSTTLTFSDTSYQGSYNSAIISLYEHLGDKNVDEGDVLEISGIVTLNDGTDNIYVDADTANENLGRVHFEFNSDGTDRFQLFIGGGATDSEGTVGVWGNIDT